MSVAREVRDRECGDPNTGSRADVWVDKWEEKGGEVHRELERKEEGKSGGEWIVKQAT